MFFISEKQNTKKRKERNDLMLYNATKMFALEIVNGSQVRHTCRKPANVVSCFRLLKKNQFF